jgi:hypothetical protein
MSSIPYLTIYTGSENVIASEYVDIDFSAAVFSSPPVVATSVEGNINVFVSNITTTTARINFSSTFTGAVSYIIRPAT